MPASTGRGFSSASAVNDPLEEARRKLAQAQRMFTATGDYNTQASEARADFLRPEVQGASRYDALGVLAPPEVAGYTGGDQLVSGRLLTTVEQLQRTFQGEDIAAQRTQLDRAAGSGGGYQTARGLSGGSGGDGYTTNRAPVMGRPFVGNPIQAGFYGDTRQRQQAAPSGSAEGRGGGEDFDAQMTAQMKAVGLVPTKFTSDGRSNSLIEYVRPEEAKIREKRNAELVGEEYERRFGPDPRLKSKYAGLSEAALVEYAVEGALYPSEDPANPYGSDEGNDAVLINELRSRRDKDGSLLFNDAEIEVILRSVRAERTKRRKAGGPALVGGVPKYGPE